MPTGINGLRILSDEGLCVIINYNYMNFSFFHLKNLFFYWLKIFFWIKTGCSLILFDVIFRCDQRKNHWTLEVFRKKIQNKTKNWVVYIKKIFFKFEIKYIRIILERFFRWNYQNSKVPFRSKVMVKKLLKMSDIVTLPKSAYFPSYQRYRSQILIAYWRLEWRLYSNFTSLYILCFPINKL